VFVKLNDTKQHCSIAQHSNLLLEPFVQQTKYQHSRQQPLMGNNLEVFSSQPLTVNVLQPFTQERSACKGQHSRTLHTKTNFMIEHCRKFAQTVQSQTHAYQLYSSLETANPSPLQLCSDKLQAVAELDCTCKLLLLTNNCKAC